MLDYIWMGDVSTDFWGGCSGFALKAHHHLATSNEFHSFF